MTNMTSQRAGKGYRLNKLESKLQDEQKRDRLDKCSHRSKLQDEQRGNRMSLGAVPPQVQTIHGGEGALSTSQEEKS